MHWRNEKEWASWSDREIDGLLYTFAHLRSFDMLVEKAAKGSWPAFAATIRQYQVYFDLYKPATQPVGDIPRLLLYVQSAFLKNEPFAQQRHRFKAFGAICAEVAGVIPKKTRGKRQKPP